MNVSRDLQHTRAASLRNLCLLCKLLKDSGGMTTQRDLMLQGKELGLREFEDVTENGALPTRVRHHDYALRLLELVDKGRAPLYLLTTRGQTIGSLTSDHAIQPDTGSKGNSDSELPVSIRSELRKVMCSSLYVRQNLLKYFMARDRFQMDELLQEGKDVVIELVPRSERLLKSATLGENIEDSGYRLHSSLPERKSLLLDEAGRREIYEGLRKWAIRTELLDEIIGWDRFYPMENEFACQRQSKHSRLSRLYVVKWHWNPASPIEEFESVLVTLRQSHGNPTRIHIPELIMELALEYHMSLRAIRESLAALYRAKPAMYFLESASRWLLEQRAGTYPLDSYVQIDGTWRTSIVFPSSGLP